MVYVYDAVLGAYTWKDFAPVNTLSGKAVPVPGSGQNGQTITYDNSSSAFVFTALSAGGAAVGSEALTPTGVTYQTFSRNTAQISTGNTVVSGTLRMAGIYLPASAAITSISACSGATGLTTSGTNPHFWVALFDQSRALLAQSTDDTAATWAANTLKTTNLAAPFTTTYAGLHYLGFGVNCGSTGTMPAVLFAPDVVATLNGLAPVLQGNSTTSITGTAPATAGAITATTAKMWAGAA